MKHKNFIYFICLFIFLFTFGATNIHAKHKKNRPPKLLNPFNGRWVGPCRHIGENAYLLETIEFKSPKKFRQGNDIKGKFTHTFNTSKETDCSSPWYEVTIKYFYRINNVETIENQLLDMDLRIRQVFTRLHNSLAVDALNSICDKRRRKHNPFREGKKIHTKKIECDSFDYPSKKEEHLEIIQLANNEITLGQHLPVFDFSERPAELAEYSFTFVGSVLRLSEDEEEERD